MRMVQRLVTGWMVSLTCFCSMMGGEAPTISDFWWNWITSSGFPSGCSVSFLKATCVCTQQSDCSYKRADSAQLPVLHWCLQRHRSSFEPRGEGKKAIRSGAGMGRGTGLSGLTDKRWRWRRWRGCWWWERETRNKRKSQTGCFDCHGIKGLAWLLAVSKVFNKVGVDLSVILTYFGPMRCCNHTVWPQCQIAL